MRLGHFQGDAEDHTNSLRPIWGPSDFTKHWKSTFQLQILNTNNNNNSLIFLQKPSAMSNQQSLRRFVFVFSILFRKCENLQNCFFVEKHAHRNLSKFAAGFVHTAAIRIPFVQKLFRTLPYCSVLMSRSNLRKYPSP